MQRELDHYVKGEKQLESDLERYIKDLDKQ